MKSYKAITMIFCCILACAALLPAANASESDQLTQITFSEPVQIPGTILPAGTYWFKLLNSNSDQNTVQIFTENWQLCATLFTIPVEHLQATDGTEIEFAERPQDQPQALLKWFYPGMQTGHEFLYSSKREKEFGREGRDDVVIPVSGI
jgi:hypothetical protein